MSQSKLSTTVQSLIATSLSLPGMQELLAQQQPEEGPDYRFTHYDEEPIPEDVLAFGDPGRYRIDSHQLRWTHNLDGSYSLEVGLLHEAMSGSSPWYVIPGQQGQSLQVMSGATLRENRDQLDVSLRRLSGNLVHTLAAGISDEDDYGAVYGSYRGEKQSSDGLQTWSWGMSYSDDDVEPSDAQLFGRIDSASRDAWSVSWGFTQVINRNSVIQTGASFTRQGGYLSDPYKLVWVDGFIFPDQRPDARNLFTWTTRWRYFVAQPGASLQLDYRYFRDSWDIVAHTLEAAWVQPLGRNWQLIPGLRYHSQSAADFYQPFFTARPQVELWSSDYRLATFGAVSAKLDLEWSHSRYDLKAAVEYYDSSSGRAVSGREADTPGLVDFWRISTAFSVRLP